MIHCYISPASFIIVVCSSERKKGRTCLFIESDMAAEQNPFSRTTHGVSRDLRAAVSNELLRPDPPTSHAPPVRWTRSWRTPGVWKHHSLGRCSPECSSVGREDSVGMHGLQSLARNGKQLYSPDVGRLVEACVFPLGFHGDPISFSLQRTRAEKRKKFHAVRMF